MQPSLHIRGHQSFDHKAQPARRVLALATDLPFFLITPAVSIWFFGTPPIPGAGTALLWLLCCGLIVASQRKLFGRTVGERLWGLKHFKGRGCLEQKSWSLAFQVRSLVSLAVSVLVAWQMAAQTTAFHPMLKQAIDMRVAAFTSDSNSSRLPFYLTIGAYPKLWKGEPVWYQLPYVKGPPERFPARVVVRLPVSEASLVLEGPRTPEELRGKRDWVKACLASPELRVRTSSLCLGLRRGLLLRHSQEMRPGGKLPGSWGLFWFEVDNPSLGDEARPMGVYLRAANTHHQIHRFILLTSEGQAQALTLEVPSAEVRNPELEMMFRLVGSMSLHPTVAGSRSWADRRLSETRLSEVARRPELDRLGELAALLIAKTSVSPRAPDAYFHLAGVSMLLLKKSASTPAAELVSAIARPQIEAALKFMRDVAPGDPRNQQLERMALEVKQFR